MGDIEDVVLSQLILNKNLREEKKKTLFLCSSLSEVTLLSKSMYSNYENIHNYVNLVAFYMALWRLTK